ncbi:MAG: hypothetical protein ACKO37_09780 [Vampirovibrionales bacterium]
MTLRPLYSFTPSIGVNPKSTLWSTPSIGLAPQTKRSGESLPFTGSATVAMALTAEAPSVVNVQPSALYVTPPTWSKLNESKITSLSANDVFTPRDKPHPEEVPPPVLTQTLYGSKTAIPSTITPFTLKADLTSPWQANTPTTHPLRHTSTIPSTDTTSLVEAHTHSQTLNHKREDNKTLFHFDLPVSGLLVGYLTWYHNTNSHPTLVTYQRLGELVKEAKRLQALLPILPPEVNDSFTAQNNTSLSAIRYDTLAHPEALDARLKDTKQKLIRQADALFQDRPTLLEAYKDLLATHAAQLKNTSQATQQTKVRKGIHQLSGKLLPQQLPFGWEPNKRLALAYTQAAESLETSRQKTWQAIHQSIEQVLHLEAQHTSYARAWHGLNAQREGVLNFMESKSHKPSNVLFSSRLQLYPFEQHTKELGLHTQSYIKEAQWQPMMGIHRFFKHAEHSMATSLQKAGQLHYLPTKWEGFLQRIEATQGKARLFAGIEAWVMGLATMGMITLERRVHRATDLRENTSGV